MMALRLQLGCHQRYGTALTQRQLRAFSSTSNPEPDSRRASSQWWNGSVYAYMFRRGVGIATRTISRWPQFIDFYEHGGFAKGTADEARTRMLVLTSMPQSTVVDLFEFMTGATHAVKMVYRELYKETHQYPEVCTDNLELVASKQALDVFTRKPRRQAQQFAVHDEPRKTRLVLQELELVQVGLASVDYETKQLPDEEASQKGYTEEEWLRMEVAYKAIEHVVVAPHADVIAIDDAKTFETSFAWTFEANVTKPDKLEWRIINATDFNEKPALIRAQPRTG